MRYPTWHKSTYSSDQGGNCVEVTDLDEGGHAIRDSQDPTRSVLTSPQRSGLRSPPEYEPATSTDPQHPTHPCNPTGGCLARLRR
jgi:hypothetical protein